MSYPGLIINRNLNSFNAQILEPYNIAISATTTEVCEKETLQLDCNWGEKINLIKAAYGIESSRNNCGIEFRKDCVAMNTISVSFS